MMANLLLPAAVFAPLALTLALGSRRARGAALWLAPVAGLPALVAAATTTGEAFWRAPWLLHGMVLTLDPQQRLLLLFVAFLWVGAGLYGAGYLAGSHRRARYAGAYLLAMAGNFGLLLAADVLTFFTSFALMSFAAYVLVVHEEDPAARRAGRIYLILAIVGEALLVAGLALASGLGGNLQIEELARRLAEAPNRDLAAGLLIAGFGIKAGLVPLHVWLPLAHPVAPTPASAVLSGAMVKAGLVGALRFLPHGLPGLEGWGAAWMWLGAVSVVYGVVVGLAQTNPKTILAYSSISQMGYVGILLGASLAHPVLAPSLTAAALAHAFHHGLAKGALFLGVGVARGVHLATRGPWARAALGAALGWPVLALGGAPFSSGAAAKRAIASALAGLGDALPVAALLMVGALGTTLLMGRFLVLLWREDAHVHVSTTVPMWAGWGAITLAVVTCPWLYAGLVGGAAYPGAWSSLIPLLAAAVPLAWWARRQRPPRLRLPAGDLVVPIEALARRLGSLASDLARLASVRRTACRFTILVDGVHKAGAGIDRAEAMAGRTAVGLGLFLGLAAVLLLLVSGR